MGVPRSRTEATEPSTAVVEAVASAGGWEPTAVPEPLYDVVDPDALDAFVASTDDAEVSFTYMGYEVTVAGDGGVTVDDAEDGDDSTGADEFVDCVDDTADADGEQGA